MMKSSELVVLVDSVEEAVKFYTEKLAFDLVDARVSKEGGQPSLSIAHLRKGKCFIAFRTPAVEEFAEFSFIKRCASRCVGLFVEIKKGLPKVLDRCRKKNVKIISELKDSDGYTTFALRDPFGLKVIFAQPIEGFVAKPAVDFVSKPLSATTASKKQEADAFVDDMIAQLKQFGILRRASKKYAKTILKTIKK